MLLYQWRAQTSIRLITNVLEGEILTMHPPQILANNKNIIAALQPNKQAIPYTVSNWCKYFPNDELFNNITAKHPNEISRSDLFEMATNLQSNYRWDNLRELFISIMLWGFGTTGYGAYRTDRMVRDSNFQNTIESSYKKINDGNILKAYNTFSLDMCGSAFFTKFFYFVGKGSHNLPIPLILDSVVACSLEERCGLDISRYAKVSRYPDKPENARKGIIGKIAAVNRYAHGYMNYINDIADWARHLEVTPDQIELFLFS